ncbi:MAG: nucleotidyltransferase domain-containing protein [Oscillospiraceae bacterium]|nr:nucleotidyltransferase domain-containing protein [Oscillospiraceae bacterium]
MCSKTELDIILADFISGLEIIFGETLIDVILFGSYARGDNNFESDVDIAVLADIPKEDEMKYVDDIIELMSMVDKKHNYAILLSPTVLSYKFFKQWQETIPFYRNIANEGVTLSA